MIVENPIPVKILNWIIKPFGWKYTRWYIGRWSTFTGKMTRSLTPMGWRWAKVNEPEGKTALDLFLRDLNKNEKRT